MTDFQNPNQDPGSERRLLLTFALVFVVIFIAQQYISKYYKPPSPPAQKSLQSSPNQEPPASSTTPPANTAAPAQPEKKAGPAKTKAAAKAPVPIETRQASAESETVIENSVYRIAFTNRGGLAKSWILKKYKNDKRQPLELINSIAAPQFGYPLSLYTYDEGLRNRLNQSLYVATETGSDENRTLTFEYSDGGLVVSKKFQFGSNYQIRCEISVTQNGTPVSAYPVWAAGFGDETVSSSYAAGKIDINRDDKIDRTSYKKVSGGATINGPFNWAGTSDQYFAAVFLPDNPDKTALVTFHNEIRIPKNLDKPDPNDMEKVPVLGAAVGMPNGVTSERIFVGPKALDVVSDIRSYAVPAVAGVAPDGPSLEKLVDFGFFSFFAKWLFLWLRWTYEHWVPNYGWAILILTVIINIAMLPLRISTIKSGMKMQKIQPQVSAINAKYKKYKLTDPRQAEKNREIQELYKKEGVNPLGGCLPNLIQLPFLWAFYTMLGSAIELRHASWAWMHDLSAADPTHIITYMFVASMFVMQRITPTGGIDPAQQKMMQFTMPILLGVFDWNLSAGLSLYWAASNVLGIVQQLGFNRTKFGREMREHMLARAAQKKRR